jgi:hypothetical protein
MKGFKGMGPAVRPGWRVSVRASEVQSSNALLELAPVGPSYVLVGAGGGGFGVISSGKGAMSYEVV